MEEANSQPDNPPTIIDLDSPDDHDLSDPNYTEDHMVDEEIEEEKSPAPQTIDLDSSGHMIDEEIEEEAPQTIDSDPWAQVLSEPNHTEDHVGDEEVEDENEENDESRDSDRRNLRAQRRADSPNGQHEEEESMPRDTDTSKSRPDSWGPPDSTKETGSSNNKSSRSDTRDPDAKTNRREKVGRSSDAWGQQPVDRVHRSRSISPRDGYNRSHRNRSRTRSRSRSRSPSGPRRSNWRSPVGGNDRTGNWRSPVGRGNNSRTGDRRSPVGRGNDGRSGDWRSPVGRGNDDRPGGDWRSPVDRDGGDWRSPVGGNDRRPAGGAQPCRDFMAGRCRRGPQCRFLHPDEREGDNNRDRERDNRERERGRGSSRDRERDRDRYPPPRSERDSNKDDIYDSRGQSEYSRQQPVSQGRKGNYDEPGYNYGNRSSERCFDFTRGRCKRGADCRFIHEEASGQGRRERDERERERGERDERESYRGGGGNYEEREGTNSNLSRVKKEEICKFYLEGRCGRGQSCRFSHEENNSVNESSWSDSNKRDSVPSNQYMVPVTETVPVSNKIENQYNAPITVPVQVPVPPAPVMNPYMGVNPNPNLQGYNSNLQNVPAINPNQMTQSLPPPPPVNPPLPPGNPPNPNTNPNPNPNPSNLVTTEQAANITDISAYLSQILATNNPTVPVPVQVPVPVPDKPDNPVLHESPITPSVEMETNSETKKHDPPNPNPNPNPNNPKVKEGKGLKMFKCALVEVVKDLLKPSWKEGQLSREVHKTIVKKVCEKVIGTLESLPPTQEKIDVYLSHSKPKLAKLVQAYVEKFVKAQS